MKCLIPMIALTFTLTMIGNTFAQDEPAKGDKKAKAEKREGQGGDRKGQGKGGEKGQGDKEKRGGGQRGGGGDLLFTTLDADGDGTISAKEIDNALAALMKLDKNNDGQLTSDELRSRGGGQGGQGKQGGQRGRRKQVK